MERTEHSVAPIDRSGLLCEAEVFARYLMGSALPPGELSPAVRGVIDRYPDSSSLVPAQNENAGDHAILAFAGRHPWSLPFLDAASGLLRRHGLLRSRLLLLTAMLEASPALVDEFSPRVTRRWRLLALVVGLGLSALARIPLGLLLYPIARGMRP